MNTRNYTLSTLALVITSLSIAVAGCRTSSQSPAHTDPENNTGYNILSTTGGSDWLLSTDNRELSLHKQAPAISCTGSTAMVFYPSQAYSWPTGSPVGSQLFGYSINSSGTRFGSYNQLTGLTNINAVKAVYVPGLSTHCVVYYNASTIRVQLLKYSTPNSPHAWESVVSETVINTAGGSVSQVELAVDPGTNRVLVVWRDTQRHAPYSAVYGRLLTFGQSGSDYTMSQGTEFVFHEDYQNSPFSQGYPAITFNSDKSWFTVIWNDYRSGYARYGANLPRADFDSSGDLASPVSSYEHLLLTTAASDNNIVYNPGIDRYLITQPHGGYTRGYFAKDSTSSPGTLEIDGLQFLVAQTASGTNYSEVTCSNVAPYNFLVTYFSGGDLYGRVVPGSLDASNSTSDAFVSTSAYNTTYSQFLIADNAQGSIGPASIGNMGSSGFNVVFTQIENGVSEVFYNRIRSN